MALETETNKTILQGNAATYTFPYSFIIPTADVVVATFTDDEGTQSVLSPAQYTITGLADANGGTVTYPLTGSAMASGTTLTIERVVPYTQPTVLTNQGGYYPAVVEGSDDWIVMQTQQLAERVSASLQFPATDPAANSIAVLPAWAARANKVFGFDASGNVQATDPSSGAATNATNVNFLQTGTSAISRTVTNKFYESVSVFDFMTAADVTLIRSRSSSANQTTATRIVAAINAAITSVSTNGGMVFFPQGIYPVNAQITVTCLYPVTLYGEGMSSQLRTIANISGSMIKYVAGGGGDGGGLIRDLFLYDATTTGGAPGSYTMTAGLHLQGFVQSRVQRVGMTGLNCTATTGGAILGNGMVQSKISDCIIQYCNEGINMASIATGITSCQGLVVDSCNIEDTVGASVYVNANTFDAKIVNCGFENGNVASGYFVQNLGTGTNIEANHFNRSPYRSILTGSTARIVGNYFSPAVAGTVTTIYCNGNFNVIASNTFYGGGTKLAIEVVAGIHNTITGNTFYYCGAIIVGWTNTVPASQGNVITDNTFRDLLANNDAVSAYWITDGVYAVGTRISGNTFADTSAGPDKTQGFIQLMGQKSNCSFNVFTQRQARYDILCSAGDAYICGNDGFDAFVSGNGGYSSWVGNRFITTSEPYYNFAPTAVANGVAGWTVTATATTQAYLRRNGDRVLLEIKVTATGGGTVACTAAGTIAGIPSNFYADGAIAFTQGVYRESAASLGGLCTVNNAGTMTVQTALVATAGSVSFVLQFSRVGQ